MAHKEGDRWWRYYRESSASYDFGHLKLPTPRKWKAEAWEACMENGKLQERCIYEWRYFTSLFPKAKRRAGERRVARAKQFEAGV